MKDAALLAALRLVPKNALSRAVGALTRETSISKLYWATLHQQLGELAMQVLGPAAEITDGAPYDLTALQRLFLFSRADTIYGGSNEIQRNIIGERVLGLPSEPKS